MSGQIPSSRTPGTSGGAMPWIRLTVVTVGLVALGIGLMKAVVPTPEQTYQAMAPDLRKKVDAARAARLAQNEAVSQQLAAQANETEADKPVWASPPPSRAS